MSDPSPIPASPPIPPSPDGPSAQPAPNVPPAPSQVRAASGSDSPWGAASTEVPIAQPDLGSFTVAGEPRRRGVGTRVLLVALGVAALVGIGIATGTIRFFTYSSKGQPSQAVPSPLGQTLGGRFGGSGITFLYPKTWQPLPDVNFTLGSDSGPSGRIVLAPPPSGLDVNNNVVVATYALQQSTAGASSASLRSVVKSLLADIRRQGATVERPISGGHLGDTPAFLVTIGSRIPGGPILQSRMFFAFEGSTEYFVACQSTPEGRATITAACKQIVSSFHVDQASS